MEELRPWQWDWSAIAAFFAAIMAGTAAYMSSRTAKQSWKSNLNLELVKLRERWIENLRLLMAEYISVGLTTDGKDVHIEGTRRFMALHSQILLMLDPEKDNQSKQLMDQRSGSRRSDFYFIPFTEIENLMQEIGKKWASGNSTEADFAVLQVKFHSYLRHHWLALKEENVHTYVKNF